MCDGQLSGLCLKGLTVAEVSPESAVGGPLSLVENGDRITIDVDAQVLDLEISETELVSAPRASVANRSSRNRRATCPSTSAVSSRCRRVPCWSKARLTV